ncbi:MAG TPA: DUF2723 domain-containing protein [Gemmatimonadaceae bacterium]|nr:DUF2723 domain-containing protein [Gemmatimonadaceae bacterium]
MIARGDGPPGDDAESYEPFGVAAPIIAVLVLGAVYLATLAPGLTFWDSGELIAAVHSLGIPHPPGTPLYVTLARAWREMAGPLSTAVAVNSFSALCTALAAGALAWLLMRVTRMPWAALGAALCAGAMSTVWLDANEAEVYAASLLLAMAMLLAAERAGGSLHRASLHDAALGSPGAPARCERWTVLTAYCMALAVPLHISALVAAPGAIVLAAYDGARRVEWPRAVMLTGALLVSAGAGLAEWKLAAAGGIVLAASPLLAGSARTPRLKTAGCIALVLALGISVVAFMPIRALHEPALDSGNPTTWNALWEVTGRRQYELHGLWPRQAPLWAQVANFFEYADWQVALGLAPGVAPSWVRTPVTIAYALLGVYGAARHRDRDGRSWLAFLMLFACASLGLVIYLNFKAGASFGYGVLPDALPHEARERDYFFSLAFFTWGAWAGFGAVSLLRERSRRVVPLGLAIAALPIALNWRAVDRSREPEASMPHRVASALLWSAPPRAVLVTWGDNDSFPLWYLQVVEGVRRDVSVVVAPLLGAEWYRAQLARRDSLLLPNEVAELASELEVVGRVMDRAEVNGRPVAVAITADSSELWTLGSGWVLEGVAWVSAPPSATSTRVAGLRAPVDTAVARAFVKRFGKVQSLPFGDATDPAPRIMARLLDCPAATLAAARAGARVDSLASGCKWR